MTPPTSRSRLAGPPLATTDEHLRRACTDAGVERLD